MLHSVALQIKKSDIRPYVEKQMGEIQQLCSQFPGNQKENMKVETEETSQVWGVLSPYISSSLGIDRSTSEVYPCKTKHVWLILRRGGACNDNMCLLPCEGQIARAKASFEAGALAITTNQMYPYKPTDVVFLLEGKPDIPFGACIPGKPNVQEQKHVAKFGQV